MQDIHSCTQGFQSTCPRGARLPTITRPPTTSNFNPRAHEGHDAFTRMCDHMPEISIHVPTRGTTVSVYPSRFSTVFQSTCPRGARQKDMSPIADTQFQSTCPRGARHTLARTRSDLRNFNPRAHEGHDDHRMVNHPAVKDFNPRAHEGHDVCTERSFDCYGFQSTCPRGARLTRFAATLSPCNFNPRAHEGHDCRFCVWQSSSRFQSTCPRGARLPGNGKAVEIYNFNPRAHEGHDILSIHR